MLKIRILGHGSRVFEAARIHSGQARIPYQVLVYKRLICPEAFFLLLTLLHLLKAAETLNDKESVVRLIRSHLKYQQSWLPPITRCGTGKSVREAPNSLRQRSWLTHSLRVDRAYAELEPGPRRAVERARPCKQWTGNTLYAHIERRRRTNMESPCL